MSISILIADDQALNLSLISAYLRKIGFTNLDVATDGALALEKVRANRPDLLILDIMMPELDGYETTREIRRREGDERHTPIVAMTASTLPDDRERCMAAGMDYHTGKPIRPAGLDYIIAQAIRPPVAAAQ